MLNINENKIFFLKTTYKKEDHI